MDKHWFIVRDTSLKTDRLITLVPLTKNCSLNITPMTKNVLNDLFLALQHPYICPIFDIDFLEYDNKNYVIVVQPISQGSLKDLIYGVSNHNKLNNKQIEKINKCLDIIYYIEMIYRSKEQVGMKIGIKNIVLVVKDFLYLKFNKWDVKYWKH